MEDLVEVVWHSACYSSYTSKRNIQFASSIDTNDAASEEECEDQERASRSSRSKIDWSKCFFCKKKTYKKVTELINVSTFTACQTIKRAATIQGDEAMLHLLLGGNDDLMAAEAKYHKNCYSLYIAKKVRDDKGESSNESHHENAFKQLVEELRPGLEQGRVYDMTSLLVKYRDYRVRFVPVHDVCQNLSNRVLKVLPAFHALTGCDTTSTLSGIGEK